MQEYYKNPAFEYKVLLKNRRKIKNDGMAKCCIIYLGVFRETILIKGGILVRKDGVSDPEYQGNDKLLLGLFLAVITFGLFAQTIINIATTIRTDLGIDVNASNIAVSLAALFSGIFIVLIGGLGDRFGRIKITKIGLV